MISGERARRFWVEKDWRGGIERRWLTTNTRGLTLKARVQFEPRDVWLGVFWQRSERYTHAFDVYVCLVPMLPLIFEISAYGRWVRRHPVTPLKDRSA